MAKVFTSVLADVLAVAAAPVTTGASFFGQKAIKRDVAAKEAKAQDQENTVNQMYAKAKQDQLDATNKADNTRRRDQSRANQRAKQAAAGGRASTILTSPLGVTGEQAKGDKTLLGS
jgi:flagellar motility protein MotE (MotC chaperone)